MKNYISWIALAVSAIALALALTLFIGSRQATFTGDEGGGDGGGSQITCEKASGVSWAGLGKLSPAACQAASAGGKTRGCSSQASFCTTSNLVSCFINNASAALSQCKTVGQVSQ